MSTQQNIKAIQDIYAAFGRGEVGYILSQLTNDIRWVSHMEAIVPWSGDFSGKDRIPKFFDAIFQNVDVEGFVPSEFIAEGDTVVSLGEFACRVRQTGKSARTRWVFIWKFTNGQVSSYEQFHDPAIAAAFA